MSDHRKHCSGCQCDPCRQVRTTYESFIEAQVNYWTVRAKRLQAERASRNIRRVPA